MNCCGITYDYVLQMCVCIPCEIKAVCFSYTQYFLGLI